MGELMDPRLADVEASRGGWTTPSFFPAAFALGSRGLSGSFPASATSWIALISLYIVNRALQLGIPRVGVARMVLNVGIEGLLGAAPFVGDLFDVVFKANRRNYILLNHYLAQPRRQRGMDWLFLLANLLVVIAAVALPIWLLSWLVSRLV